MNDDCIGDERGGYWSKSQGFFWHFENGSRVPLNWEFLIGQCLKLGNFYRRSLVRYCHFGVSPVNYSDSNWEI